jgi:hypothetical protein
MRLELSADLIARRSHFEAHYAAKFQGRRLVSHDEKAPARSSPFFFFFRLCQVWYHAIERCVVRAR